MLAGSYHMKNMKKLTILNTRPPHQSQSLTQAIETVGASVLHLPLFNIEPISFSPRDLKHFSHLIFQSQNAVAAFLKIQKNIPDFMSIIAIGSATQRALQEAGYAHVLIPDYFSSEGVLAMPAMQHVHNKTFLIVSGENPKPLLRNTLRERGAHITVCECYRRVSIAHNMKIIFDQLQTADTIITTSGESLTRLLTLFDASYSEWLFSRSLIVISGKMKMEAVSAGFQTVIQADDATDQEIMKAVYILVNRYKIG